MREYIVDPFETMRVAEIMTKAVDTLPGETSIEQVITFLTGPDASFRHKSYPVVDGEGQLLGIVARADVLRWTREGWPAGQSLADVLEERECVFGFSDEPVGQLADRMAEADVGRVPILSRASNAVIGLVARRDLLRVRATTVRHERHRETLIRFRKARPQPALALRNRRPPR
jgi:CBS domain-containing protein